MKHLSFLICFNLLAGFSEFDENNRYDYRKATIKIKAKKNRANKKNGLGHLERKLIDEDRKILNLLKRNERNLIIRVKENKVMALSRIKGVVLNSILAMNVSPSTFIVRFSKEDETLEDSEIRCLGYSFQKRVHAKCNLLVLNDKEYPVDVTIWDLDGAEGILADYFYSGEEKAFLTSSFASFLEGVLDIAKTRVTTPFGEVTKNTAKNKMMNGIMGVASNAKEKVIESGEKNLSISYVNSGKEVLVFFNKTLKLSNTEDL